MKATESIAGPLSLTYNIQKLYGQAFPNLSSSALFKLEGLKDAGKGKVSDLLGLGFQKSEETPKAKIDWTGVSDVIVDESNVTNYLGLPVFQPIVFGGESYYILDNGIAKKKAFKPLTLPYTSTVELTRSKQTVKSHPNGSKSSVKEIWGFNDWDITIRGIVITEGVHGGNNHNLYPKDETKRLAEFDDITDSIAVSGGMFNVLGIKRLFIDTISFGKIVGTPNAIPFQLRCCSDEPLEIIMLNNQLG